MILSGGLAVSAAYSIMPASVSMNVSRSWQAARAVTWVGSMSTETSGSKISFRMARSCRLKESMRTRLTLEPAQSSGADGTRTAMPLRSACGLSAWGTATQPNAVAERFSRSHISPA